MKISSFIKAVTTRPDSPVWLEQLGTPIVNQHQNLALVWVPFQFFRDEVISHCDIILLPCFGMDISGQ